MRGKGPSAMTKDKLEQELERCSQEALSRTMRIQNMQRELIAQDQKIQKMRSALERLRDCDWMISLPDRMDAVREIAKEALQ